MGVLRQAIFDQRSPFESASGNPAILESIHAAPQASGAIAADGTPVATLGDVHADNLREPPRRIPAGQALLSLALARPVSRETYEDAALARRRVAVRILDDMFDAHEHRFSSGGSAHCRCRGLKPLHLGLLERLG